MVLMASREHLAQLGRRDRRELLDLQELLDHEDPRE